MAGNRPHFWSPNEIDLFLNILIRNQYGPVLFVVGAHRNEHAFAWASEELAENGYFRTSGQCRSKFKTLRQQFNTALLNFGPNPPRRHQSPFWRELKILWRQSQEPDPAHMFPAGAGPACDVGLRQMARVRLVAGQPAGNAPQGQEEVGGNNGPGEDEQEEEKDIQPGMDVMQLGVRREELQNVIFLHQDLAERAIEEELRNMRRAQARRQRRR